MLLNCSLLITTLAAAVTCQTYTLRKQYDAGNFFSEFTFNSVNDPNGGYGNFVDRNTATTQGLASVNNGQIVLRADSSNVAAGRGRNTVWLQSNDTFDPGTLVVADLAHMPASACGVWPSFFTINDQAKPFYGEIDILEAVNLDSFNVVSLHTDKSQSCVFNTADQAGSFLQHDCSLNTVKGCEVKCPDKTFGDDFNNGGGGVYAMALESDSIRVWIFPRSAIPADIGSGNPSVGDWPKPVANLNKNNGGCNIGQLFTRQMMIFKIDFCGQWPAEDWVDDTPSCQQKVGTSNCASYVMNNPQAFSTSYFLINSVKVFGH